MENFLRSHSTLTALALLLTGCAAGTASQSGPHLSPTECHDLAALRSNAPPTMAEHQSELSALRKAGYDPSPWSDDPYYPEDIQAAERQVDYWFKTECPQAQRGSEATEPPETPAY
ncbi:DUF4148 domain-containing protein [Paraburkholderia acidipaludis]|uniref:DUF4148 domain-containing protein n=1 Tax=Paraburkholderia acidipaludis TaxID=660537 RepID=UPI0009FE206F|nr:DUF4148 domain-containing protein [Paraburkholderia acidipaludis]